MQSYSCCLSSRHGFTHMEMLAESLAFIASAASKFGLIKRVRALLVKYRLGENHAD
ncbi:hypothetical protein SAMN05421881_105418 [Nitrosomonas halophila]|uniref:Uncharacterized protein n=1 Tax=Nitrosomonas halophila TaxID=44576 RepID=A0A1H3LY35_9PROT|nr:hypothetical protein SAMN05421881_105418 [Nitrosomonas halophila]